MKVFIFAVLALFVSLIFIFFTQYYISSAIDDILYSLDDLPTNLISSEKASEKTLRCLNDSLHMWQKRRFIICLMLNQSEFDEIEDLLSGLYASAVSGDSGIYSSDLITLKENLSRLKKSESLSLNGIL